MSHTYEDEAAHLQVREAEGDKLRRTYEMLRDKAGLDSDLTLTAAFLYTDHLILVYRLGDCDQVLSEIAAVCRARPKGSDMFVRYVQAAAFLRFKQARFAESIALFEEQLAATQESIPLLENMGHAYNSVGNDGKAEECFTRALHLMDQEGDVRRTRGGILLGLGTVKQNRNDHQGALPHLLGAVEWFKNQHKNETSLQAKASTSVARTLDELGRVDEAEQYYRDAVRIFTDVVGADSPLTANALAKLGMQLYAREHAEAEDVCQQAFERCCALEKDSLRVSVIATLYVQLHNIRSKNIQSLSAHAAACARLCQAALDELARLGPLPETADIAVLYKALGEDLLLLKDHTRAARAFEQTVRLLQREKSREAKSLCDMATLLLVSGCYPHMNSIEP